MFIYVYIYTSQVRSINFPSVALLYFVYFVLPFSTDVVSNGLFLNPKFASPDFLTAYLFKFHIILFNFVINNDENHPQNKQNIGLNYIQY